VSQSDESLQRMLSEVIDRLVFLGFNSYVTALDRDTGELVWSWRSPKGTSDYVALLLDGDRLIASIHGYTYCLNPLNGEQIWANPLSGYGLGIPTLVSVRGASAGSAAAHMIAQRQRESQSAAHTTST
jgi:outer membrane protein assembly factor BamB